MNQEPLPGLETEAALDSFGRTYRAQIQKQEYRQVIATALAEKILGHTAYLQESEEGLSLHEANPEEDAGEGESLRSRFAALLLLGAAPENHVVGQFNGNEDATFAGGTALWKSSLRLDPNWMETMRKRSRKHAQEAFHAMREELKKDKGEWANYSKHIKTKGRYGDRFLTLTMPHRSDSDSLSEVKRFNLAFRYLTKGKWWMEDAPVFGGIKAIEDALTIDGPHVHGHFALIARRMDQDKLHLEWTKALKRATWKLHRETLSCEPIKPDLRSIVKRIKSRWSEETKSAMVTWDDALFEITKYLTKTADLLMPHRNKAGELVQPPSGDVLFDLCMVRRWPRMFELLKAARGLSSGTKGRKPSLDTSCISVPAMSVPLPEHWEEGGIEPEERADFRLKCANASCLGYQIKKEKPPSWRDLMQFTTLSEWLQVIHGRVMSGRRFRTSWLRQYNKDLNVSTLNGTRIVSQAWPEECML